MSVKHQLEVVGRVDIQHPVVDTAAVVVDSSVDFQVDKHSVLVPVLVVDHSYLGLDLDCHTHKPYVVVVHSQLVADTDRAIDLLAVVHTFVAAVIVALEAEDNHQQRDLAVDAASNLDRHLRVVVLMLTQQLVAFRDDTSEVHRCLRDILVLDLVVHKAYRQDIQTAAGKVDSVGDILDSDQSVDIHHVDTAVVVVVAVVGVDHQAFAVVAVEAVEFVVVVETVVVHLYSRIAVVVEQLH